MTEQVSIAKSAKIVGRHLCTGPNISVLLSVKYCLHGTAAPAVTIFQNAS